METHHQKVALVSGAARGIGQAICLGLAEQGAIVVAVDLHYPEETKQAIELEGGQCIALQGDVSEPNEVSIIADKVMAQLGRVDILINNVGVYPFCNFFELTYESWRKVLSINLDSHFLMCKAFLPSMRYNGWGRIVNITSNSIGLSIPDLSHYLASKMGVIGFTRGLANDVAQYGITVNALGPTLTRTPGTVEQIPSEDIYNHVASLQAIKKIGEPEDVVGPILFLTSEYARFITGQTYMVDGGLSRL